MNEVILSDESEVAAWTALVARKDKELRRTVLERLSNQKHSRQFCTGSYKLGKDETWVVRGGTFSVLYETSKYKHGDGYKIIRNGTTFETRYMPESVSRYMGTEREQAIAHWLRLENEIDYWAAYQY